MDLSSLLQNITPDVAKKLVAALQTVADEQEPAKTASYLTNPSKEDFTHTWDKVPYTIKAGQTILLPTEIAQHLAKHLANREMAKNHAADIVDVKNPQKVNIFLHPSRATVEAAILSNPVVEAKSDIELFQKSAQVNQVVVAEEIEEEDEEEVVVKPAKVAKKKVAKKKAVKVDEESEDLDEIAA